MNRPPDERSAQDSGRPRSMRLAAGGVGVSTVDGRASASGEDRIGPRQAAGPEWQAILGESEPMRHLQQLLARVARRTASGSAPTILITGETGTGKGLLARRIHGDSVRRSRAFVDINCAALPAGLIEAELFGYERGAFTDARDARAGLFETACGGTLFLDEIGSLQESAAVKLLTAIEEKQVRRLGGRRAIPVDVQIIAATHQDLAGMVERKEFREDLFHRLNVLTIELPPLRDRGGDKLVLAEAFLASFCREYEVPFRRLSAAARAAIARYPWPGNVRELKNRIERVVLLEDTEVIEPHHLRLVERSVVAVEGSRDRPEVELPAAGVSLSAVEREIIRKALAICGGNVTRAARFLSVSRQTLIYRMKKFGL